MKKYYSNYEVMDYIWQHSRYHGNLIGLCQHAFEEENGHLALITLMNIAEMIFKNRLGDYDEGFFGVIKKIYDDNLVNDVEYSFLNNPVTGVRKIKNLLAHANLSKYNIKFINEEPDIMYPLTENETCLKLYNKFSPIIYNILLRLISTDLLVDLCPNVDSLIESLKIEVVEVTPEELLAFKGIDYKTMADWSSFPEEARYRLAENASDVNVLASILKNLL